MVVRLYMFPPALLSEAGNLHPPTKAHKLHTPSRIRTHSLYPSGKSVSRTVVMNADPSHTFGHEAHCYVTDLACNISCNRDDVHWLTGERKNNRRWKRKATYFTPHVDYSSWEVIEQTGWEGWMSACMHAHSEGPQKLVPTAACCTTPPAVYHLHAAHKSSKLSLFFLSFCFCLLLIKHEKLKQDYTDYFLDCIRVLLSQSNFVTFTQSVCHVRFETCITSSNSSTHTIDFDIIQLI